MENREQEIRVCRGEVAALKARLQILESRLDALEGKPAEVVAPQPVQIPPQQVQVEKTPPQQNLESAVGRNLFAVLASVLVLIGVGVFISTIYEQIPEVVKIAAIYMFGFVLLGVGLVIYRKNDNKFWLGVASCGLAELLVSIITSHSYFGILPLIPTFALVLVWILSSFWLTRFHPTVFKTIGFVGFLISISLGLNLVAWNEIGIYVTLLGAYVVLSIFFMVTNRDYVNLNTAMACFSAAGLLMFWDFGIRLPEELWRVPGVVFMVILGVFHGVYVWKAKLNKNAYPMYSILTVALAVILLAGYRSWETVPVIGVMVILLWAVQHWWDCDRNMRIFYTALAGAYLAFAATYQISHVPQMWWFMGFAAAAYGLYWLTKQRDIAWLGWLCYLMFYLRGWEADWVIWVLFLGAGVMFLLSDSRWLRRDRALQTAWYVTLFAVAQTLEATILLQCVTEMPDVPGWTLYQTGDAIFYTLMAAANVWYLHRTMADREKLLRITPTSLVVMAMQVYAFLECMTAVGSELWYVTALGILGSMMILSYSLWYSFKTRGTASKLTVWQFVKFTLYAWAVLVILDSPNILTHISLLLVAILAVAVGFKLGHKAVRVYGLALSLVDVVSLVLFNIDYGNSLQLAGGIVLCGILCFVISFIYSRLSKVF